LNTEFLVYVFILTLWIGTVQAQSGTINREVDVVLLENKHSDESSDELKQILEICTMDHFMIFQLDAECENYLQNRISYSSRGLSEAERLEQVTSEHLAFALNVQTNQSKRIFMFVQLVTVFGFLAAGFQFYLSIGNRSSENRSSENIEFEITEKSIKIKTAWMGVLLFGMSYLFFITYLIFVYPIHAIRIN